MYKKGGCKCKVLVLLIKPIVFLTFTSSSASLALKVPIAQTIARYPQGGRHGTRKAYNRVQRISWLESHNDSHVAASLHIYMGLALNFRHMYLILINRFITHVKKSIRCLLQGPQNKQYNNGVGVLRGQRHIPSKNFSLAVRIQRMAPAKKVETSK